MTRWEIRLLHLANLLVGGTGLVYAWFRYFAPPLDEFALIHPGQAWTQHTHIVAAPLLVFTIALFWRPHALAGLRLGLPERRRTGIALLALATPMIASGYLLQIAVEPGWRQTWIALHLATSAVWLLATGIHLLGKRR